MNRLKAAYFDTMATAPWAVDPSRMEDRPKIARLPSTAEIRPGVSVLEPGCGTGRLTAILSNAVGSAVRVIALDISGAESLLFGWYHLAVSVSKRLRVEGGQTDVSG